MVLIIMETSCQFFTYIIHQNQISEYQLSATFVSDNDTVIPMLTMMLQHLE